MQAINIGIVCVGNCASSLVQGLSHYRAESNDHSGLMHWELGGYRPCDIRLAAAWDIDRRKVGRDIAEAIFARPNCTQTFCGDVRPSGVKVEMGRLLDGRSEEPTSELQSLMRISFSVFCLKKKKRQHSL